MGFLTPLSLAFAALSIPIIVLCMLRLRRWDVLVSSTLLGSASCATGRRTPPGSV